MRKWWWIFLALVSVDSGWGLHGQGLRQEEIPSVMQPLLRKHVDKKNMTGNMLQQALSIYIDQFDPQRLYLLESEVSPFLNLSSERKSEIVQQYAEHEFTIFKQLNRVIQASIERSRKIREELERQQQNVLFDLLSDKKAVAVQEGGREGVFSATTQELKLRLIRDLQAFIEGEQVRYGSTLSSKRERILRLYEERRREFENRYLYQDENGAPLPLQEQENLFVLHILKALSKSLDTHTAFYQTNEAYDMRVRLQKGFEGIGITFQETPNGVVVTHLLEGGPAIRSGQIQIGDRLLKVNDRSVEGRPFDEVMDGLRGEKNTEVTLVFAAKRDNNRYSVKLNRERVIVNDKRVTVTSEVFGNGIIGKITLYGFYEGEGISSEKDVRNAIENLKKEGRLRGLILDLRDNRGGFVSQAVKVAGLFITDGVIVMTKDGEGEERFYRDVDSSVVYDGPLIVLISKATASAAEIVAQALQDYGVALVVGDAHTYGKGTLQAQTVTGDRSTSYFKVTIGKYYTVSGNTPQKQGVKSDIVVPGRWNREQIGEMYAVDALEPDTVPSAYHDQLQDISFIDRLWYLRYYVPNLQNRETLWRELIPTLRENSAYRIAHNKNYQFFLKGGSVEEDQEEEEEWNLMGKPDRTYGEDDLQEEETFNILKDMIYLDSLRKKQEKTVA